MSTDLDLVHEEKDHILKIKIQKSNGESLVVNAHFNTIHLKAVKDTAAMLTLVSRKYAGNYQTNYEAVELKGLRGLRLRQQTVCIGHLSFSWEYYAVTMDDDILSDSIFLKHIMT